MTIDGRIIVAPAGSGRCRECGHKYHTCKCGKQYCPVHWGNCPRCHAAPYLSAYQGRSLDDRQTAGMEVV